MCRTVPTRLVASLKSPQKCPSQARPSTPAELRENTSVALQTEAYEECLQTYSVTTCYNVNGTAVDCASEDSIDSFQMPDW